MTNSHHLQPLFDLTKFEIYLKYTVTEAEKVNICKAVNMYFTTVLVFTTIASLDAGHGTGRPR